MFKQVRDTVLELLRVPEEPQPPAGTAGTLRVFRASKRWYRLQVSLWGIKQAFALLGVLFVVLVPLEAIPFGVPDAMVTAALWLRIEPTGEPQEPGGPPTIDWGDLERPLFILEMLGVTLLVAQAAISYALLRLDWELRWYMTTDRSLRIREGTWQIREKTLTLANVQNVTVNANPLQRLLGIADVNVRTAGGGSGGGNSSHGHSQKSDQLHEAVLRHVEDAPAIRDLILARLRAIKDAGLGDPDDRHTKSAATTGTATTSDISIGDINASAVTAARSVLHEARALRSRFS
jgi:membrane protein YdbS with pleckstrin-like domain